jgi:hypothetical protein
LNHDDLDVQIESSLVSIVGSQEIDKPKLRASLAEIETVLKDLPQLEIKINHHFGKGVYAREMIMPKHSIVVGKIHKYENLNCLSKGMVTVVSTDGVVKLEAPCTFVASPGVKRILFAHTDVVWTNFHGTHEKDLAKIEDEFIAKDYSEVENITEDELQKIKEAMTCHG